MADVALLDHVDRVRRALRSREDLFEIVLDRQAPPATPEEVAAAEQSLGHALPDLLRDFYRTAGALFFEWEIRPGRSQELGYQEENAPHGILRIPAPEALARRGPSIAQITVSNGAGDGWALVHAPDGAALQVTWLDHERPEARTQPRHASVAELFGELAAIGFACDGDAAGIERFLRAGPPEPQPKSKARAEARAKPRSPKARPARKPRPARPSKPKK